MAIVINANIYTAGGVVNFPQSGVMPITINGIIGDKDSSFKVISRPVEISSKKVANG
jgi:hypothetical protein